MILIAYPKASQQISMAVGDFSDKKVEDYECCYG